ncbi:hypothetical protein Ddye_015663 [Dipteronia dyeriana]|uniref:MULE transposase domain-containing protein n=1 Tax=Dipteronia dyeriana TaxID=168575 RepID=A0AAD9U5V5_9ROSI|nr:hypothetical protein Ddye_015663 [Dipteronia dyeriana]
MNCDNLVESANDLVDSEFLNLQASGIMGKEFISVTDAEEFNKKFSYVTWFNMCKDRLCRDAHGLITVRRVQTREGCREAMKINFDREKMLSVVTEFGNDHCHKLLSGNHNQFLRSHRHVDDCDIVQVQSLRSIGMKTSQVMDHLLDQSKSYAVVGHNRKDLQNRLDTLCRSASCNSDADSIIPYMTAKSEMDPGFFFRYSILEDGSMVIFVDVNNHTKATVFGFGLLVDETINTYTWILQTFLEAMHDKCPISVVTDGDIAMSKALMLVMGIAVHRLCSWYIERNVQMNVCWFAGGFELVGYGFTHTLTRKPTKQCRFMGGCFTRGIPTNPQPTNP